MKGKKQNANWHLRLYIAEDSPLAESAVQNLQHACEKYIPGEYWLEVVDIARNPERAFDEDIIAIPTLVRLSPAPVRRVIGTSDLAKLAVALGFPTRGVS